MIQNYTIIVTDKKNRHTFTMPIQEPCNIKWLLLYLFEIKWLLIYLMFIFMGTSI